MCEVKASSSCGSTMRSLPRVDSLFSINTASTIETGTFFGSNTDLSSCCDASSCCGLSVESVNVPRFQKKKVRFQRRHKTHLYYRREKANEVWWSRKLAPMNKQKAVDLLANKVHIASLIKEDAFFKPDIKTLTDFSSLCGDDCLRGLENYVCRDFMNRRVNHKSNYVIALIDMETELKQQGVLSREEIAEKIAEFSREQSQHAMNYARAVGKADEYATINGELYLHDLVCSSSSPQAAKSERRRQLISFFIAGAAVGTLGLASSLTSLDSLQSLTSICH